jgi:hypothetical protein
MSSIFPSDPAQDAKAVTPSDTANQGDVRALYVGGAGNISLVTPLGTTVVFTGVQSGSILPVRCTKVLVATTATNIVALL